LVGIGLVVQLSWQKLIMFTSTLVFWILSAIAFSEKN
jgi:hypothetical protein